MAIAKKTIEAWAAKLGIKADDVSAALAATEDVEIAIPDGVDVFTAAQIAARDNNKYNEGKEAGEELAVKAVKEKHNLDFKGKKVAGLLEHIQANQAGETETVKQLRANLTKAEQEKDQAVVAMSSMKLTSTIHGYIPELNNGMNKAEAMSVMQANGFEFKPNGDSVQVFRNGQPVKDAKMLTDIAPADAVKSFFAEEKKWVGESAGDDRRGRGGSSGQPGKGVVPGTMKEVQEAYEAEHGAGSSNGAEYGAHLQSKMKEAKEAGQELK